MNLPFAAGICVIDYCAYLHCNYVSMVKNIISHLVLNESNVFLFFFLFSLDLAVVWSLFFQSPSMIYISQQHKYCQMAPPHKIEASNDASTSFSFSSCLSSSSPTATALTSAKKFLLIWIENDFWRWRDLNPHPSNLLHDELDHRTMVSWWNE